jgi:hypothetical protein
MCNSCTWYVPKYCSRIITPNNRTYASLCLGFCDMYVVEHSVYVLQTPSIAIACPRYHLSSHHGDLDVELKMLLILSFHLLSLKYTFAPRLGVWHLTYKSTHWCLYSMTLCMADKKNSHLTSVLTCQTVRIQVRRVSVHAFSNRL